MVTLLLAKGNFQTMVVKCSNKNSNSIRMDVIRTDDSLFWWPHFVEVFVGSTNHIVLEAFYFVSLPILLLWMRKEKGKMLTTVSGFGFSQYTKNLTIICWLSLPEKWILTCKWAFLQKFYSLILISKLDKSKYSITLIG